MNNNILFWTWIRDIWIIVDVLITKFLCAEPVKDAEVTEYSQTKYITGKLKFHVRAPTNIFCHNFIRYKTKYAMKDFMALAIWQLA